MRSGLGALILIGDEDAYEPVSRKLGERLFSLNQLTRCYLLSDQFDVLMPVDIA